MHLPFRKETLTIFAPAIIWAIVIFALSISAGVQVPKALEKLGAPDKLAHAAAYFVLALLWIRAFYASKQSFTKAVAWGLGLSISFGILMEIIQFCFFPHRYFEFLDIVANIIGSLLSVFVFYFLIK